MNNNYFSTVKRECKILTCGKCKTVQQMYKMPYGDKPKEFSWWCTNCEDKISQSACYIVSGNKERLK